MQKWYPFSGFQWDRTFATPPPPSESKMPSLDWIHFRFRILLTQVLACLEQIFVRNLHNLFGRPFWSPLRELNNQCIDHCYRERMKLRVSEVLFLSRRKAFCSSRTSVLPICAANFFWKCIHCRRSPKNRTLHLNDALLFDLASLCRQQQTLWSW